MTSITEDLKATEHNLRGMRSTPRENAVASRDRDRDERDLEWLKRADEGETYRQIAEGSGVAYKTVANRVQMIRQEMD
ncbi:MAG: hypothetical protein AAGK66_07300 [Pseudomonadota bacterium]